MSDVHSARYESVHLSIDAGHALGLTYTDPEAAGTDDDSHRLLAVSCLGSVSIFPTMISFTDMTGEWCDMPVNPVNPSVLITTGAALGKSLKITGFTTEGLEPLTGEAGLFEVYGKPFVHNGQVQQWVQYYDTSLQVPFSSGVTLSILTRRNPDALLLLAKQKQKLKY